MDTFMDLSDHHAFQRLSPRLPSRFQVSEMAFTLARSHLIITPILQFVAILVISARLYTRAFPVWKITADDYIVTFAFALMSVAFGLWYRCTFWAWHGHPAFRTIDSITFNSKLGSIALPFWAWSTGLVKISIGIMLLRFQQTRSLKVVIHVMIALNVLLILLVGVVNLFQCIPYAALWDLKNEIEHKTCWKKSVNQAMVYSSSVCNVLTDIVFSLMPLTFLWKIRRPLREKVVVGGLMALGLLASAFSLTKAVVNGRLFTKTDTSSSLILMGMLSCLEVQTALIAACAPTLRNSSKRFFRRIGLSRSEPRSSPAPYAAGSSTHGLSKRPSSGQVELTRSPSRGTTSTYHDSELYGATSPELEEARYERNPITGRITCTTELRVHSSRHYLNENTKTHEGWAMENEWKSQKISGTG